MNILITGSSGFIAKHVLNKCINKHKIVGIDLISSNKFTTIFDLQTFKLAKFLN